jgi:transcriptional regulator with XRE-family HTH domain
VEVGSSAALGSAVRAARRAAKLSQQELADRAGMSRVSVARLEAGVTSPTWDSVLRVASVLGMKFDVTWNPDATLPTQPPLPKRATRGSAVAKSASARTATKTAATRSARSAATTKTAAKSATRNPSGSTTKAASKKASSKKTAPKRPAPVDLSAVLARTSRR